MSTETQNQAADKAVAPPEKITFTPEQQAKVEELIREANGRATRPHKDAADKLKSDLDASKAALASLADELAGLKTVKPDVVAGQREEMDRVKSDYERQLAHLKEVAAAGKKESEKHQAEFESLRRTNAITSAVGDIGFYKPEYVSALTESRVRFDSARGKFVVLNDQGTERMNSSFEPMSLKEYYQEFAAENPFLVKGTAATGVGSTQSAGLSSNGIHKVEDIFGPKSNAKFANDLAKTNINEYRRLKSIAQANHLI